jgi:DNA-binding Lrp family transcriptional regulator
MTFQATVYRFLIAAPKDVIAEQKAIQEITSSWNTRYSAKMKAFFLPVLLETHLVPGRGVSPQATVNKQIMEDCDILIGAFWTRIGSDTGLAESITMEYIDEFQKAGKPVMIYLSSAPVVPSSVDLKQYEKLMNFMNDCLKQGLVTRYDSILDFREKVGTQLASRILNIHKTSEIEPSKDPGETSKKESIDRMSKQFCEIIERYNLKWTSERKNKPINLDDGKRILADLTRDISSLKETLSKIFSKEIIEHIDQILSNLMVLQKHRLYFNTKSYTDFWKSGNEIFATLDAIVGKVRKEVHIPKIDNDMLNILIELSKAENTNFKQIPSDAIAKETGLSLEETNYYLKELLKAGFISHLLTIGSPTKYFLSDAGRRYLVERGIK